jgi:two-component sensor histidine kinase
MECVPEDLGGYSEPKPLASLEARVQALEKALETLHAGPTMESGGPAALRRKIQHQRQAINRAMAQDKAPRD